MTSKTRWVKRKREPVEISVADARISGPAPRVEIAERRAVEQDFVVQLGRQFGTAPARRPQRSPVSRIQETRDDLALYIAFQEALLVVGEQLVAIQAIGERSETSARHAADDVDFIEQADFVAVRSDDLGLSKELQHPVGEGGGTRAAAREGEDDQVFLVFDISLARLETVPRRRVGLGDRRIDRAGGAAAQQDKERGGEEVESVCGIHRSLRFVVFSSLTTSRRLEFQSHSAGPVQLYDASAIRPWSDARGRSATIGRHVGGGRLDADQPARPHLRSPPQAKWSRTARATRDASIPVTRSTCFTAM